MCSGFRSVTIVWHSFRRPLAALLQELKQEMESDDVSPVREVQSVGVAPAGEDLPGEAVAGMERPSSEGSESRGDLPSQTDCPDEPAPTGNDGGESPHCPSTVPGLLEEPKL